MLGEIVATDVERLRILMAIIAETVAPHQRAAKWNELIASATISPGRLVVELDGEMFADRLGLSVDRINVDHLRIRAAFQLRRKGVETKIILGCEPAEVEEVLIRNIVKAKNYFEAIRRGETFAEIASRESTSKRRVQDVVDLAFLTPDILKQVISGTLPMYVTSDFLIKQGIPGRWSDQRDLML